MPRRRRVEVLSPDSATDTSGAAVTPLSNKIPKLRERENDVSAARGKFQGALLDAMEYSIGDSDSSFDHSLSKNNRNWGDYKSSSQIKKEISSDDDDSYSENGKRNKKKFHKSNRNNSYVMKLFDRSVDLAQFTEKTPLYTICRAWMANKPRSSTRQQYPSDINSQDDMMIEDGTKLPPPIGHPVSRVPPLLPEQCTRSKYNINLNYDEEPPLPKEVLLKNHLVRWHAIRKKWLQQSIIYESRYANTQDMLNEMDTNS